MHNLRLKTTNTLNIIILIFVTAFLSACSGTGTETDLNGSTTQVFPQNYDITNNSNSSNKSVTLNWEKPTQNTDDSDLMNLAGYRIYYSTSPILINSSSIYLNDPDSSSFVFNNLASNATYYFVITSVNEQNIESRYSNIVSKTI